VLLKAGQPMADRASQLAPDDPSTPSPDLHTSIFVSTKLNKTQAKEARKEGKSFQEVYVGTNDRAGVLQEFGTEHSRAQPFMRPAFDSEKFTALEIIRRDLGDEIEKTAARAAKRKAAKTAKLAAGG
jgi:HK97 gp10 family phage protein